MHNRLIKNKKGSIIVDLFFALFIFLVVLVIIILLFNFYSKRLETQIYREDFRDKVSMISEILLTEGKPSNWDENPADLEILGLLGKNGQISKEKWDYVKNMDYADVKEMFGLTAEDFIIRIGVIDGEFFGVFGPEGGDSNLADKEVISFRRITIYNNKAAVIDIKIWRKPIR